MNNKKIWIAVIALVAVVAAMLVIWIATRPEPVDGSKNITVEIVHKDGSVNTYSIQTDAQTLAEAMNEKELLGEDHSGIYYTIDGETTDYSVDESWWCLYVNGEKSNDGANTVTIVDGSVYKWVYTIGWA